MKNWTCCVLSAVLLFVSSFQDINFAQKILQGSLAVFMGLENNEERMITIDLSPNELSNEMQIEIEEINAKALSESLKTPSVEKDKTVLVYHTHTDEAYFKGEADYVETSTGRTKNQEYSVVKIGDTLKNELTQKGYTVIHDTTDNVASGFNKAYETSYRTIKKYIGSADVFIDVHRDAYLGKEPNYLTFEDTEYAFICFVVAKGENYDPKPNWQENYLLAKKLTNKLNEICPGICKDIVFKDTRFNQHVSTSCILAEMGNEKNTLAQVEASTKLLAKALDSVL